MVITLIGFSGSGKGHLAAQFAERLGWETLSCDDLIEEQLEAKLPPVAHGIRRVADWLGHPYEPGFKERQLKYLECEESAVAAIARGLQGSAPDRQLIVDTTGSVVYLKPEIVGQLKSLTKMVYLQIPPSDEEAMYQQYLREPKPLIWRELFQPRSGEENMQALHRCYPLLLRERATLYERLADVKINAQFSARSAITPDTVLHEISQHK